MEFVSNIDEKEYKEFMLAHARAHFMQTPEFGEIRKIKKYVPHFVGMKKDGKLVCAAMLLEKRMNNKYIYYYVPRGYTIDYSDKELLRDFTSFLYKYCKENNAVFLKIDPAVKRYTQDIDGNKIQGEDNSYLIDYLKKIGYHHLGFNLGFEGYQPRFTFIVDINKPMDEVFKSFHATTRKVLNKGNHYDLKIYKGNLDDIESFYETMKETAKREGIVQAPIDYYRKFYKVFNEHDMSDLYVVKVNVNDTTKVVLNDIELLKKNNEGNEIKLKENKERLLKLEKLLNELKEIKEKEIVLASIITVKYKDKVWTVHGGNNSKLMSLNANYLLYYEIIKDANSEGKKYVDLFGTCGYANPKVDNPIYGIHFFKKRLGGEYTEFIGEFDLVINKSIYKLYRFIGPIRNKIIHSKLKRKN